MRRRMGVFVAACLAAAVFALMETVRADTRPGYQLLTFDGRNVKWGTPRFGAPAVIRFAFLRAPIERPGARNCQAMQPWPERAQTGGLTRRQVETEIHAAFVAWERHAALSFIETDDPTRAELLIGIQTRPRGIAFADITYGAEADGRLLRIKGGAMCFNPTLHWEKDFDGEAASRDIRYVAIHEIGHLIGLDHAWGQPGAVMNVRYRERIRGPQAADISGARQLYGPAVVAAQSRNVSAGQKSAANHPVAHKQAP